MSSSPPNPPDEKSASSSNSSRKTASGQPDQQAVETFEFEVSAGAAPSLDSLPASAPETFIGASPDSATILPERAEAPKKGSNDVAVLPQGILVDELSAEAVPVGPKQVVVAATEEARQPKLVRRVAKQSSWWITSLGVHVLVLLVLAFSTLAIIREEKLELYSTAVSYEPVDEFQDLEIDPTDDLDSLDEELSEPDPALLEEMSSELLVEEPTVAESAITESPNSEFSESLSDLGGLLGDVSTEAGGMDSEVGTGSGGGMAKFFGTAVKARRILYMLDNSGGMRKDGKFEALVLELMRSVNALGAKQEFYVIFYSDTVYPLFYPQGVREFVRSNDRNRNLLDRWLATVELCGGNAIDEALAAAEIIRPETVFLLTDGDLFTTEKKKALLLNPVGRSYSIHTFGLGVGETTKTADRLRQVAEANSGSFRAVYVTPEMKVLASKLKRPYHSTQPGAVWGLKVGSRR
ncbi:MAG: hypothetical protein AAGD11_11825 [Planctomycetota bacterium]